MQSVGSSGVEASSTTTLVDRIATTELERFGLDDVSSVGGPREREVVDHHGYSVSGQANVELYGVGAGAFGQLEGGKGVLRGVRRCTPVRDDQPTGGVEKNVRGGRMGRRHGSHRS